MRSVIFIFMFLLISPWAWSQAQSGYFELSANGSYMKYNNGQTLGEKNFTTVQRLGGGLAYKFLGNTSIEFRYTNSKNIDRFTQESVAEGRIYRFERTTQFHNYGLNLVLEFARRGAQFRPFITGGLGYMIRQAETRGTFEDSLLLDGEQDIEFTDDPKRSSISADGGIGFKLFVADRIALEATFNVFATDLDKDEVFLHYSGSGGLRFVF